VQRAFEVAVARSRMQKVDSIGEGEEVLKTVKVAVSVSLALSSVGSIAGSASGTMRHRHRERGWSK
jgi:cation transporter-like permease